MQLTTVGMETYPSPPKVLVVDDELRILSSLKILLEMHGFKVDTAQGGIPACKKLASGNFDLVFLDLLMEDFSGQQVMRYMAAQSITTSVIVISGQVSFSVVSQALRKGASDYLKKPFTTKELIASAHRVLAKTLEEQKQNERQERLYKSDLLQRYILDNSPDIVFMLDQSGRFSFVNSAVENSLGYSAQELKGSHFSTVLGMREMVKLRESFADIKRGINISDVEVKIRSKQDNQSFRHFELSVFPLFENTLDDSNEPSSDSKTRNDRGSFIGIYGSARDITDRKDAQDYVNFQAYHDLLTRLPNRRLFYDRLSMAIAHCKRHDHQLAVLFLDLDRFKMVNDRFGHTLGDQLLQSVAIRLQQCLREGDTLSRFGGDEFVLLLPEIKDLAAAKEVAHKIISFVKEPFMLNSHRIHIGISVGIAVYPGAGKDIEQLIRSADAAMYHAKDNDNESYHFFDESLMVNSSNRLKIESDLRNALEQKEFEVYYQPQLNIISGEVLGVEALIRWHHPERGTLYPDQFMAIAEEANLVIGISEWVMAAACRQVKQWIDAGYRHLRLAVNLAAAQVAQPEMTKVLKKILLQCRFPPANFEAEITEEAIMNDLEALTVKLGELADAGITVTIDGFGTGYSSLSWLKKLPIHAIKVDRAFIQEIQDNKETCLVNGIVAMAQGLNLNIIAEGVETSEELNHLKDLGCEKVQGFIFAEARTASEVMKLLDKNLLLSANAS